MRFLIRAISAFSLLMSLMLLICDVAIGLRVIGLLFRGIVNIALCGEFVGVTAAAALFFAAVSVLSDKSEALSNQIRTDEATDTAIETDES